MGKERFGGRRRALVGTVAAVLLSAGAVACTPPETPPGTGGCPATPDLPDIGAVDANCDGIDGDRAKAIFVSPTGSDANDGTTPAQAKASVTAAVAAANPAGRNQVLIAGGTYTSATGVDLRTDVSLYGGYSGDFATRTADTVIRGLGGHGALADADTGVTLQRLTLEAARPAVAMPPGTSLYGIRAVAGSSVTLDHVTVIAGNAYDGAPGSDGTPGQAGVNGARGADRSFATTWPPSASRPGGFGGGGGRSGDDGAWGGTSTGGGFGGYGGNGILSTWFDPCGPGGHGGNGSPGPRGIDGLGGSGGQPVTSSATSTWAGARGTSGNIGTPGSGGGGGGGGGGVKTATCITYKTGGAGGSGGAGGVPGGPGSGGSYGGGSFAMYVYQSHLSIADSTIVRGDGGRGGQGGDGVPSAAGGMGGPGGVGDDVGSSLAAGNGGAGGKGGDSGASGPGGGGAGGPSIGIFVGQGSTVATARAVAHVNGTGGSGGSPGVPGAPGTPAGPGAAGVSGNSVTQS